jgi:hypothetical protein
MANIGGGRVLRVCDACGGVDDHPRHTQTGPADAFARADDSIIEAVIGNAPDGDRGRLLSDLLDQSSVELHRDCCRERGCPTGDCDRLTAGAEDLRGGELLNHLVSLQESGAKR